MMASGAQPHGAEEETGGVQEASGIVETVPESLNMTQAKSSVGQAVLTSRLLRSMVQQKQVENGVEEELNWRWTEDDRMVVEMMEMEAEEAEMEARQVIWWGDKLPRHKEEDGVLRLVAQNMDKMGAWREQKQEGGDKKPTVDAKQLGRDAEDQWRVWKLRGVDLLLMGDTGLQDPINCLQPALQSAGRVAEQMKRVWGDEQVRWVTAQGYRGKQGGWKGGSAIAQVGRLKPYAGKKAVDCRGLGR